MRSRLAVPAAFLLPLGLPLSLALAGACAAPSAGPAAAAPAAPAGDLPATRGDAPAAVEDLRGRGEKAGIHNLDRVGPGILRGSQPEGDASFALLADLGVKTVLSVDGARPDVEGAANCGLRYIHLPMEYSGIPREGQVKIAKAAKEAQADGLLFVHCHYGKHRGPAAAGIAWMARDGASAEAAVAEMKKAGTDRKYEGLYADVEAFEPVTAEELARVKPEELAPVSVVPDLVGAMVRFDVAFEHMKAVQKAGWKTPAAMPDVRPAHEARILAEHFREAARLEEVLKRPEDFRRWMGEGEKAAWSLEEALRAGDGEAAKRALETVDATCNSCHGVYRNTRKAW